MAWNRQKRRKLSQYGLGEQMMKEEFARELNAQKEHDYRMAWASAFLALHEITGMGKDDLQRIAERTVEIGNNALCASELVQELKNKTGFDVDQRPSTYVYGVDV